MAGIRLQSAAKWLIMSLHIKQDICEEKTTLCVNRRSESHKSRKISVARVRINGYTLMLSSAVMRVGNTARYGNGGRREMWDCCLDVSSGAIRYFLVP